MPLKEDQFSLAETMSSLEIRVKVVNSKGKLALQVKERRSWVTWGRTNDVRWDALMFNGRCIVSNTDR